MTGSVVSVPRREHECTPGWTDEEAGPDSPFGPGRYGIPPSGYDYPAGTVWRCECGQHWVSEGPPSWNSPGLVTFRRERRRERRRRERGERESVPRGGYAAGSRTVSDLPPPPASVVAGEQYAPVSAEGIVGAIWARWLHDLGVPDLADPVARGVARRLAVEAVQDVLDANPG